MTEAQQEVLNNTFLGCECRSYNAQIGFVPTIPLKMPIRSKPAGEEERVTYKVVSIDACIAPLIQHLWDNGITTGGCCCGHNGKLGQPSIVLGEGESNFGDIRELIAQVDPRNFELSQWKRVIV